MNAESSNINGFTINPDGTLSQLAGSQQSLSAAGAIPGHIQFKPDGKFLLVAEKTTNTISAFPIGLDGKASPSIIHASAGQGPAGFAFLRGSFTGTDYIIVPELGAEPTSSSISTYSIAPNGTVSNITVSMPLQQATATSVATTNDGVYSFVTNTGSNSISAFKTGAGGTIQMLHASAGNTDNTPADIALSGNEKYLFVLNKITHSISGHKRQNNESLSRLNTVTIPNAASGLAAVNKLYYQ